eukprot:TRINITY_DN3100_c0_g1_i2.p1 TRINITY_DN3100_c0_g1~~TRINITY_DN3100_c0_g1_i2.p1  ORF type:complete len:122 (+),score=17.36 TRINITY_DN3100_c0_g1_i2:3-368(+)
MSLKRLQRELAALRSIDPKGVKIVPCDSDPYLVDAFVEGPEGTPYAGGVFHIGVKIPVDYPFRPPTMKIITPIFHQDVNNNGMMCNCHEATCGWAPNLSILTILFNFQDILREPKHPIRTE